MSRIEQNNANKSRWMYGSKYEKVMSQSFRDEENTNTVQGERIRLQISPSLNLPNSRESAAYIQVKDCCRVVLLRQERNLLNEKYGMSTI